MEQNPLDENNFRDRVQSVLDDFVMKHQDALSVISRDTLALADSLNTLLAGGKRLRAAFAYWGYRSTGAPDDELIIRAASSLEFLQACALIHDDVMDGSDMRRGNLAVHKQFEKLHLDSQWQGSAVDFGAGSAILVGDLALSWADELLATSGLNPSAWLSAKVIYDIMRTELMAGQYLDLLEQSRRGTKVAAARNVIRFKSAKYTIERPLHMGAAIAQADKEHQEILSRFGLALGEAFQLRDDLLGVFGDSETTGKPSGDDLREGKQTVLIASALEVCPAEQISFITEHLGSSLISSEIIAEIQGILISSGAVDRIENEIESLTASALEAITTSKIDQESQVALGKLAVLATQRTY